MNDIVFYYPEGHEAHFERGHPERPERVESIRQALIAGGWWDAYPKIEPAAVPESILHAIHSPDYIDRLMAFSRTGRRFDADTYVTPASWDLARQTAGGAIALAAAVWAGDANRGYALTRPPGHHATPTRAMGFCLLNNVALAAEYLRQVAGATRLAVIDIDLHHGNGTQDIFWARGDVLYISTHQHPLYPGTGSMDETGYGDGEGATVNLPFPPYSGDLAMRTSMENLILPLLERYQPEMLLVSAGFDPHWRDPLGHLILSAEGYRDAVAALTGFADVHCKGRIALFLEGGYDLEAGGACAQAAVAALLSQPWEDPLGPPPSPEDNRWRVTLQRAQQIWGLGKTV